MPYYRVVDALGEQKRGARKYKNVIECKKQTLAQYEHNGYAMDDCPDEPHHYRYEGHLRIIELVQQ